MCIEGYFGNGTFCRPTNSCIEDNGRCHSQVITVTNLMYWHFLFRYFFLSFFSLYLFVSLIAVNYYYYYSLIVRWVVGSILHGVDPLSYLSFQPVLHDWCNKGCGMCYPLCGMVHIKEPFLLIGKSSLCGGSGFPFSLSEWSLTICLRPYNCK